MAMFDDAGDVERRETRETTRDGDGKSRDAARAETTRARARDDDETTTKGGDATEARDEKVPSSSTGERPARGPTTMVFDGKRVTTAAAARRGPRGRGRKATTTTRRRAW